MNVQKIMILKILQKKNIFEKLKHFFNPGYNVLTYIRKKLGN